MIVMGLGLAMQFSGMIWLGVVMFSAFVVFTLVTLPVEFNASSRAVVALVDRSIFTREEAVDTRRCSSGRATSSSAISAVMQRSTSVARACSAAARRITVTGGPRSSESEASSLVVILSPSLPGRLPESSRSCAQLVELVASYDHHAGR